MIINELSPDMIKSLHIGIKFYGHKLKLIARSISFKYGVKVSVDVIKSYFNTLSPNDRRFYSDKDNEEKRFILILARQYYFLPETLLDKYHEEYDRDYIRRQDIRLFLTSTFNQIMALVFRQKKYILKDDVYDFVLLFMNWPILVYEDVELRSILQDLFDIADFLLQQNNNRKQRKEQIISKFGDERLQTILESLIYIDKIIDIYMQETKNQINLDEGTINIIVNKKQYKYFEQQISRYFSIINHDPFDLEDKRTHLLRYIIDKPYHYKDNFFNELDEDQSFQIFYNIFIQHINVNCKKNLKLNPFTQKQLYIKVNNLKKLLMDAKSLLLQNQFVSQVCRSILGHRNNQIDKQQLNSILEIYLNYVIF